MKNKILIIQTAFIGDVILATSLIEACSEAFPDSEIHFMLRSGNEVLLKDNPKVKKIWIWDKSKFKYLELLKLIFKLRKYKFTHSFNIQRFFSTGLVMSLIKSEYKIGFDKNPLSFFYTHKVVHQIPSVKDGKILHEVERNLKLLWTQKNLKKTFRPKLYLENTNLIKTKTPYLVMAPTSVWFTKGWPLEKWAELCFKLKDFTIYLVGAPSDKSACEIVKSGQEHIINLAGKLSLTESAKLMTNAHRVIANDSAVLHLASSVNAPTTAIFCSTIPEFGYGPLSDDQKIIQTDAKLPCRPCGLHGKKACPLSHFDCGYKIDVDKVIATL